jgi:outer membrane protein, heavy metal efflux system
VIPQPFVRFSQDQEMSVRVPNLFLALVVIGSVSLSHSAEPLTLAAAVDRTLRSNPDLAALPARQREQNARIELAGLRPPLAFDAQIENMLGSGGYRDLDGAETSLSLSQVIELGDQRRKRLAAARGTMDALELAQTVAQLDAVAETTRRYIELASEEQQRILAMEWLAASQRKTNDVERRVKAARDPEVELVRARIDLSRAELGARVAADRVRIAQRKLAAMWGAMEPDFERIEANLFDLPNIESLQQRTEKIASSADFLLFATEIRQREAEVELAKAEARASITVSAGIRRLEATGDQAFIAGFSMPLSSARYARPRIAEAQARRDGLELERTAALIKARASLFEVAARLKHAVEEAQTLRDDLIPRMETAVKATEYAWQRGRYGYIELSEAQREQLALRLALITAATNAHLYRIEIERLTGDSP